MGVELLSALAVKSAKAGIHADGGGLYLKVTESTTGGSASAPSEARRTWVYIYQRLGKRCELSLGRFPDVSLKDAREVARSFRAMRATGKDPKDERLKAEAEARAREAEAARLKAEADAAAARAASASLNTFGAWADRYVANARSGFKNAKHAAQVATTLGVVPYDAARVRGDLKAHAEHVKALRALRALPVDQVDREAVAAVLRPIWLTKRETADRVRGRIEAVLELAIDENARPGPNPAKITLKGKGGLGRKLPGRPDAEERHHAALDYKLVPGFMAQLVTRDDVSSLLLRFLILTAVRTGEARGARWGEIDLDAMVWNIPASRMKGKKPRAHRVPLSYQAHDVLKIVACLRRTDDPREFVFPGQRKDTCLSNMAAEMALRRLSRVGDDGMIPPWATVTVHGFRSSFRDWAGDATEFPREVAEAALAHVIGDKAEKAYRRGDALERRRVMMDAWGEFCGSGSGSPKVVPMPERRARRA